MAKVKITVLKKLTGKDMFGDNLPAGLPSPPECSVLKTGQEFVLERGSCPPDFCSWAFADIHRDIIHLLMGGDYSFAEKKGTAYPCCTDGLRPVIFKLERIED